MAANGQKRTFTLETCRKTLAERLIAPTANALMLGDR
jgi:hypothetical protein